MSFLGKLFGIKEKETLDQGLEKTKKGFLERISKAIIGKTSVDDEVLDQLEEELIGADVGVDGETNVSPDYPQDGNEFTGTIKRVTIEVK
jgi:signal recognition particle GTPase